ncbi:MAG: NYN domain-containing protein [Gammaproteobacteria bacterium]|nr:NYN domain-containing protein [Gammaproteobacteria bacterium]MCY4256473.1 NYN domain-containing protein [Gammaproteobacteria bacterium]
MKIHAFIDGFNLYYGALKGTPYKWLDLWKFCQRLVPRTCEIRCVNYFTAKVRGQPGKPGSRERQRIYLAALRHHVTGIDIVYGQFRAHAVAMKLLTPGGALEQQELTARGNRIARINDRLFGATPGWRTDPGPTVHVIKIEEKGSDVNLATRLVHDAHRDAYEGALVISNDSDLSEALRIVIDEIGKPLWLVSPYGKTAGALRNSLRTRPRVIFESTLKQSQLPDQIPGTKITKPLEW